MVELRKTYLIASSIFCLALLLRIWFVAGIVSAKEPSEIDEIYRDTKEYVSLAQNLAEIGKYTSSDRVSRLRGLVRTPGYPLLLAGIYRLGATSAAMLVCQAVLGSVLAAGVTVLAGSIFRNAVLTTAAGLLAAFSPTGIGSCGVILADLCFAALFLAGFVMTYRAVQRGVWVDALLAGLLFSATNLVKPSALYWPVANVVVWILFSKAEEGRVKWQHLAICVAIQLAVTLSWCARNVHAEKIFTYSAVDARSLRLMMAPRVDEWQRRRKFPTIDDYIENYTRTNARLTKRKNSPADIVRLQRSEAMSIFKDHPWLTAGVYFRDIYDNFITGWDVFETQFHTGSSNENDVDEAPSNAMPSNKAAPARTTKTATAVRQTFAPLFWVSSNRVMQFVWLFLPLAGAISCVPAAQKYPRIGRRQAWFAWSLLATLAYFTAIGGTTFHQGTRIMYPAEFTIILLSLMTIANVRLMRAD